MLLPVPKDKDRRYARLPGFFTDLHCTRALMQEQAIHERGGKNLICVLPGKRAEQVLVIARYDHRARVYEQAQGWNEAVMLPILYNALRAQDREYTFVFAEILGRAGEDAFVKNLGKKEPAVDESDGRGRSARSRSPLVLRAASGVSHRKRPGARDDDQGTDGGGGFCDSPVKNSDAAVRSAVNG